MERKEEFVGQSEQLFFGMHDSTVSRLRFRELDDLIQSRFACRDFVVSLTMPINGVMDLPDSSSLCLCRHRIDGS